ncbi:PTS sugar transporter subunit IIA [Psychrilyobacter sp.]|uniref:PTS sugar transporter subunit IIA n=1 Tax=Psychrilyobacter sp. TaxID=2586924 RepID=UPI00301B0A08
MNIAKITDYITLDMVSLDLRAQNKKEALLELSQLLGVSNSIDDPKVIELALIDREKLGSTGIGKGVAIPHAKTNFAKKLTIAFGRCNEGINFESLDSQDVKLFFVFASPLSDSSVYLKILARISRLIRNETFRNNLLNAKNPQEILNIISSEEG